MLLNMAKICPKFKFDKKRSTRSWTHEKPQTDIIPKTTSVKLKTDKSVQN